jgi:hypothetical protein
MSIAVFEKYKTRRIDFVEIIKVLDWNIKVYTISINNEFRSKKLFKPLKDSIPNWIYKANQAPIPNYKTAFLILHEAREGIWILFNYWTGGEMIQTDVCFSSFNDPDKIQSSPYKDSSLLCVWELEIFAHERAAWIKHILSNADKPKFIDYLKDTL